MGVKNRGGGTLFRLLGNRRGAAEIVGSIMFLVILFFFFTNVYLWHDQATREMDNVVLDKVNSPVSIEINATSDPLILQVTNNGGVGFLLSRLWIITSVDHTYADFEKEYAIWVAGGDTVRITLDGDERYPDGSYRVSQVSPGEVRVYYEPSGEVTFRVLTRLGNTAAVTYSG